MAIAGFLLGVLATVVWRGLREDWGGDQPGAVGAELFVIGACVAGAIALS